MTDAAGRGWMRSRPPWIVPPEWLAVARAMSTPFGTERTVAYWQAFAKNPDPHEPTVCDECSTVRGFSTWGGLFMHRLANHVPPREGA